MDEDDPITTIDVFCSQCNLQTRAGIVATHVISRLSQPLQGFMEVIDAPHYVVEYSIALCPKCEQVFLLESDFIEIPGEVCAPQGQNVLYPMIRNASMDGVPKHAARAYADAARSYQVGLYEPCVVFANLKVDHLRGVRYSKS